MDEMHPHNSKRDHAVTMGSDEKLDDKNRARYTLATPDKFGVALHPDVENLLFDSTALAHAYGGNSIKDIFASSIVTICALTACVGGLLFGFDQGLMPIILVMPRFLADFPEVDTAVTSGAGFNKGLMTAMLELGAFIGAILVGFVADRYSRKMSIAVGLAWFTVGSVIQTASFGFAQLVVGRTIGGIGIGMLSSTAPVYVSEIAPPNVRGALLVVEEFMIVLGICIMYYITYGSREIANEWCYRLPFFIQMIPGFFLCVALVFLPFSPRWLASRGRDQECLDTLSRLRRLPITDPRVQAEWINIRVEACHDIEAITERHPKLALLPEGFGAELKREVYGWVDLFKPAVIRRTLIGMALMFFQQFVGINALIYYSPSLFETLGLDSQLQLHMSGVMNLAQLVAVTASFFVFDKIGRKPLLIIGSAGMAASHAIVAIMIALYSDNWAAHGAQAWVGVAFIIVFMLFFGLSWGPVPWGMPSEVHSSSYRAKGTAMAVCTNWLCNFIIGLITPPMIQDIGYGTFVFFAVFSFLSGIWAWLIAPETKGRTLEQMDQVFKSHTAAHDHQMKYQITRLAIGGGEVAGHGEAVGPGGDKHRNLHVERV